nr:MULTISPECIES: LysM peptidoglycan-binding domain-containing protein [unclassified Microbacterium]
MRGRRVLAVLAALPAVIALSAAVIGGGAALASRDAGAPAGSFSTMTVAAGDSLWSIAEEVAPEHDPRDVVDEIVRLNALDTVVVQAGQSIAIPAAYGDGR